jgi:hypothetical protein
MLTRQEDGAAGDAQEVAPNDGVLRKIGACRSGIWLAQPLPCDGYPEGIGDFVVEQCWREQHEFAGEEILQKRISLLRRLLVT